jgi:hypothetical protein
LFGVAFNLWGQNKQLGPKPYLNSNTFNDAKKGVTGSEAKQS